MDKFIERFEEKIKRTIKDYDLINKNDRLLVAASGGKDSTSLLHLLKKFNYKIEAIFIDLLIGDYSRKNKENLIRFCKENNIKLHVISFRDELGYSLCYIKDILKSKGLKLRSCTICGILKRYLLNREARRLRATKLVIGHNLDDEAETILMNLFKGQEKYNAKLGPKIGLIKDKKFVQRIKPLYFCKNDDVKKYSKLMNFPVIYEKCPCSADVFRRSIRNELNEYEKYNKDVKLNIVNNFLNLLPKLKESCERGKINYCSICNEISRNEICSACRIIEMLK